MSEVRLNCDHVMDSAIPMDWTTPIEDPDDRPWEWAESIECPKCARSVVTVNGMIEEHERHARETDDEGNEIVGTPCIESGEYYGDGPAMNYWYPVTFPDDMSGAARLIGDLPLCAVTVDGKEGLALTGGGMDLSWEICEAFVRLGCLPPYQFASDLPIMAGMGQTARNLATLAACDRTIEVIGVWLDGARSRLAHNRRTLSQVTLGPATMAGIPAGDLETAELIAKGDNLKIDADRCVELSGYLK